jgi:hypothetical protein
VSIEIRLGLRGTFIAKEPQHNVHVYENKRTGEKNMLGNIFHKQGTPAENPLRLTRDTLDMPINVMIRRNVRRDPTVQPGDEIYDRARVIFSRARQKGRSRSASIM